MATAAPADTTVFVTGASGYIAGHVIHQLLEKGYKVRGSVRSLSNETKVKHLTDSFPGVELVEADLLSEGSFDAGIAGCDYVMHTASPFQLTVEDPQRDLVDPALNGTKNVLNASKKAGTVKRVIVTSSCAAVANDTFDESKVHTEADWNTSSTLTEGSYRFSKVVAEKAAWEFHEAGDAGFDVVVINPSFVLGPPFSKRTDSTSVGAVRGMLMGAFKDGVRHTGYGVVDVRNVAQAHIAAMEKKEASGRYLLTSNAAVPLIDLAEALRVDEFAAYHDNLPTTTIGDPVTKALYDHSKAETELGIVFTEPAVAVRDMARFLIENEVVTAPAPGK